MKNKMLYINELQKKEGSSTAYYVLQFFNKKRLLHVYNKYVSCLMPLSPRWKKFRITKIGRKYIYFMKYGKEMKEAYNV